MPSKPLDPDTMLSIELSTIMSRGKYGDPAPVIEQLYATAGERLAFLGAEVGRWVGFYERDIPAEFAAALHALPLDMEAGIALGRRRRGLPNHSTTGFGTPGTTTTHPPPA